jgi:3-polyprenyl-4-hydroxybenzoate decarboxylase
MVEGRIDLANSHLMLLSDDINGAAPSSIKERTMKMDDLRDFLELLEEFDEVQRIKVPVDWNLEMGAITRRCYDVGAPAALFEYQRLPAGIPNLGRTVGREQEARHSLFARTALALSLRPSASAKEIMQTYLQDREKLIKPIVVRTGPCKENIMKGAAVDVLKFVSCVQIPPHINEVDVAGGLQNAPI